MVVQRPHPLLFVDLSQDLRASDPNTRRLVRAAAQRDARRRQRERVSAATSGVTSSVLPERLRLHEPKPNTTGAPATPHAPQLPQHRDDLCDEDDVDRHGDLVLSAGQYGGNRNKHATDASSRRALQLHHRQALVKAGRVHRSPSTWGLETNDPFTSPAQLERMFRMCMTQLQWLRPHIDMTASHGIISKAFYTVPNVMILSGICLCAVGYLDSMGMQSDNAMRNDLLFKGRVLSEVRKRLDRSDRFLDDTTIEAICTLISFELTRLSRTATLHLRGLQTLVAMKGGVSGLKLLGLDIMLEGLDLVHAVLFDEVLLHIDATAFEDYGPAHEAAIRTGTLFTPLAALFVDELTALQDDAPPEELPDMRGFFAVLYSATACLASLQPNGSTDAQLARQFTDSLESFTQPNNQLVGDGDDSGNSLATAFGLAFRVFHDLVVNRRLLMHEDNAKYSSQLRSAIISMMHQAIWKKVAFLRTWIIAIGMAASSDPSVKSWFGSSMVQSNYFFGVSKWTTIKTVVLTFLKLRSTLERAILDPQQTTKRISSPYFSSKFAALPHAIATIQPWSVASEHISAASRLQEIDEDEDEDVSDSSESRPSTLASTTSPSPSPPNMSYPLKRVLLDHEMRALDGNFHKVMFEGDFWFTDQDDPVSTTASDASTSSFPASPPM